MCHPFWKRALVVHPANKERGKCRSRWNLQELVLRSWCCLVLNYIMHATYCILARQIHDIVGQSWVTALSTAQPQATEWHKKYAHMHMHNTGESTHIYSQNCMEHFYPEHSGQTPAQYVPTLMIQTHFRSEFCRCTWPPEAHLILVIWPSATGCVAWEF